MRIDPDTCRDPVLLSAEVRRLQAVIASGEPALTDAEREAVAWAEDCADSQREWKIGATLRGLRERLP